MKTFNVSGTLEEIVTELNDNLSDYSVRALFEALNLELSNLNRKEVAIALSRGANSIAKNKPLQLSVEGLKSLAKRLLLNARKKFVRKMVAKHGFFALQEIRQRYPDYQAEMMVADLTIKHRKKKPKRWRAPTDCRRAQIYKLSEIIRTGDKDSKEYHRACTLIPLLEEAHKRKLNIPVLVNISGDKRAYYFHWTTSYDVVKAFIEAANVKGVTHYALDKKQEELTSSIKF